MPESSHQVCDRCRHKKIKCDGSPGGCQPCRKANLACIVSTKLSKRSVSKSYVDSLVDRIAQLEQTIRQQEFITTPQNRDWHGIWTQPPTLHAGRLGRLIDTPSGSRELLGASTGVFFLERAFQAHVRASPEHAEPISRLSPAALCSFLGNESAALNWGPHVVSIDPGMADHPTAMQLVDAFFEHTESTFPLLHKPTIIQLLHEQTPPLPIERALLYCVFAIGLRASGASLGAADAYAAYARYMRRNIVFRPTLIDLQVLLLCNFIDLDRNEVNSVLQTWGELTRIALALGLDVHSKHFELEQLEGEMRNRVFWCCYLLDVFLSALTGLPSCFRELDLEVDLPADIEDDRLEDAYRPDAVQGRATNMSRFVPLCRLACVLNAINVSFCSPVTPQNSAEILQRESERLERLRPRLELDVFDHQDSSELTSFHIFAQGLYNYTQWSLHRSIVSLGADHPQYFSSLHAATAAAIGLIQVQHFAETHQCLRGINPAHRRETVFLAGVTVLFSQWQPQWQSRAESENVNRSTAISRCQDAIRALHSQHSNVVTNADHASVLSMLLQLTQRASANVYHNPDATYSSLSLQSPSASTSRSQSTTQSHSNSISAPASAAPSPRPFTSDTPQTSLAVPPTNIYASANLPAGQNLHLSTFPYSFGQFPDQRPSISLWQPPTSQPLPNPTAAQASSYTMPHFNLEQNQVYPLQHSWDMPLAPSQRVHLLDNMGPQTATLDPTLGMYPVPSLSSQNTTSPQQTAHSGPTTLWPGTAGQSSMNQMHPDPQAVLQSQSGLQLQFQAHTQAEAQIQAQGQEQQQRQRQGQGQRRLSAQSSAGRRS